MIMAGEAVFRYIVQNENAASRNPKLPDWEGLDVVVSSKITSRGAVEVAGFTAWLSGVQRDQAQILKQGRLFREERAAENKHKSAKEKSEE